MGKANRSTPVHLAVTVTNMMAIVSVMKRREDIAIKAIKGLVALTALGIDWAEDDTVITTMNGISNITFIKLRRACRTEVLKNGDGRTDASSLCLAPGRTDRTRRLLCLTLRRLTMNPLNEN